MTTLTGAAPHTPDLFMLYRVEQKSRSVVDDLLDGDVAMQLHTAGPRRGEFQALFLNDEAAALALAAEIATGEVITITGSERSSLDLDFILDADGTVVVELDDITREDFTVTWNFIEATA